jgi:hypothetical protein
MRPAKGRAVAAAGRSSDREAVIAALRASLAILEQPAAEERYLSLEVVAQRLGLVRAPGLEAERTAAVDYVRRELRDELPVVRLSRTALVVREASLEAFIRRREALARRPKKIA